MNTVEYLESRKRKIKKIKMPKCPKTISGEHHFTTSWINQFSEMLTICDWCDLVDDRKKK